MSTFASMLVAFGPLALTIMGVAVSVVLWNRGEDNYWIWIVVFLIVGIPTSLASLHEVRAPDHTSYDTSDRVVGQIRPAAERPLLVERVRPATFREKGREHRILVGRPGKPKYVVVIREPTAATQLAMTAPATKPLTVIPPNTLSCTGFTKNDDGTWQAGGDTQPFNIGNDTNVTVRDQGPISAGYLSPGGTDLYALLNAKCGTGAKSTSGR